MIEPKNSPNAKGYAKACFRKYWADDYTYELECSPVFALRPEHILGMRPLIELFLMIQFRNHIKHNLYIIEQITW